MGLGEPDLESPMRILVPSLVLLAGCPKTPGPQAPSMAPSSNVYLRNSFDTDPSGYIGRFLPAGLADLDESSGMTMACSEHISWRFVDGGGVKTSEVLNASTAVSARFGVPLVARGSGSASTTRSARVAYTLTGKMVSTIEDPAAFAACCKAQPDQCTDRMVGEFLQGTGSVYFETSREAGASGEGTDPSSMAGGDVTFSHGSAWQRAAEFPNPVYFAFKVTPTPYTQQAVTTCADWVQSPPPAEGGMHVVGHSSAVRTEQAARRKAMNNAQVQAGRATGLGMQAMANSTTIGVQEKEWCVEQTGTADKVRYTAHVLGFISDAEQERIRAMPTPAELEAAERAAEQEAAPASPEVGRPPEQPRQPAGTAPGKEHRIEVPAARPRPVAPGGRGGIDVLLAAVAAQSFDSDKVAAIKAAAPSLRITCAQLGQLLATLSFDSDKVDVALALRPSVMDPAQIAVVLHHFDFDSDRQKVQAAYAR